MTTSQHERLADEITESAGRLAARSVKLARMTNLSTIAALDAIHTEAYRILMSYNNRKTGPPNTDPQKCSRKP